MKRQPCVALEAEHVWLLGEKLLLLAALGAALGQEAGPPLSVQAGLGKGVLFSHWWDGLWAGGGPASVTTGKGEETRVPNPKSCGQGQMPFPRY